MKDYLLEIGCEEIPASYIDPALAWLSENAKKELENERMSFKELTMYGTPRRLVLIVRGLSAKQADLTHEVLGPRAEAAFDASGNLTKAAKGFLSAKNIDESAAYKKSTPKGDVLAAKVFEKGVSAQEMLPRVLENLIKSIPFPKVMRWEASGTTFARPVRWILSLYGAEPVPVRFADVLSGTVTTGHRFMSPDWIEISSVEKYLESMSQKFVMLDASERKSTIKIRAQDLAKAKGGTLVEDEALLDIVKNLVEYPWPLLGSFEERYLDIPKEILISEMREHQKYFGIQDENGRLLSGFVVVAGSKPKNEQGVADGHARVLRARFEDGSFYYFEDLKTPLVKFVDKLERVQFQRELGSLRDKVSRVEKLVECLAEELKKDAKIAQTARLAAHLCKADLVSGVVGQFPDLQGVMGSYYADKAGESKEVALAIREHYWPRFSGDGLPSTNAGCLVSLADKLDTLVGIIGIGKTPKGNADPFGLRRAAIAVSRIMIEKGMHLSLRRLIEIAVGVYGDKLKPSSTLQDEIVTFILGRARGLFEAPISIVDGAIAAGSDDLADLSARIDAIGQLQKEDPESFSELAAGLKRAGNIVSKAIADGHFVISTSLQVEELKEQCEKQLYFELKKAEEKVLKLNDSGTEDELRNRYVELMKEIGSLKPHVDRFFNEVMVMVDDVALRTARLALLARLQGAVNVIADFTRIQQIS